MSEKSTTSFEGNIILNSRGYGYIENPISKIDIEISPENTNKAFSGDTVLFEVLNDEVNGRVQGRVLEIKKRKQINFVGEVQISNDHCFVIPDNNRVPEDFFISNRGEAKNKDKVLVEMTKWEKKNPEAKIIEILGQSGKHDVEMRAIVLEKGFETDFDPKIEKEAEKLKKEWSPIPNSEIKKRKDIRKTTTFTIDPKDAKDFDDALSFKTLENGNYEIGIHIADVSHYVTPDSKIDKEARERAFSVYLVDRTIPMLPEILSNDLCSLNPNEDKLAYSAIFEINQNAEIKNEWFGRTVINSDKRFTYESAQQVLDENKGHYNAELQTLNDISLKLQKNKLADGAIRFMRDEFEFELDTDGTPIAIHKKEPLQTHKLIEEFMLLANRRIAKFIHDKCEKLYKGEGCGLMYRVHNLPDLGKLTDLQTFLKALGYKLEIGEKGEISPKDLNLLLDQVKGKPEESLITTATIRTMSKAVYSTQNAGHFGLAFEYYTHFTSPIRRYPDLIVHRILTYFLRDEKIPNIESANFAEIAKHSTDQEIAAQEAERTSIRYKQIEFMKNHEGEEFEGIISGVAQFGAFITIDENGTEGLVHISKMGDDYFNFDEKTYSLIGEKTNKKYTLGDKVKVKIENANLDERKIDMIFI